jgi:3-methyl-2-oxobutanoate hydroxymethyltransferase
MIYSSPEQAMSSAGRLMQQGGAQMVKLEGAHFTVVQALVEQGVPVCGHLGLLPQSIHQSGRYTVQGKEPVLAEKILQDALRLEQAGASMLVLECVPASLAAKITRQLKIPVIGIGAGRDCDGQVLVLYDILNIDGGRKPKFIKDFLAETGNIFEAVQGYHQAVKDNRYPAQEHCY